MAGARRDSEAACSGGGDCATAVMATQAWLAMVAAILTHAQPLPTTVLLALGPTLP